MTDFLDRLESDLRAAAHRRRRRQPVRALKPAIAVVAAACVAGGVFILPHDVERSAVPPRVRTDLRVTVVSGGASAPAALVARSLKEAGYTNRRAVSGTQRADERSVVLYRGSTRVTAADVAQRLGISAVRPLAAADDDVLGVNVRKAQVVVIVGPDLEARLFAESGACRASGRLQAGPLSLCTLDAGGDYTTEFVVDAHGGPQRLTVSPPPPYGRTGGGHWEWAAVSPNRKTIVATWSGECESPSAYLIPAAGGHPRSATTGLGPSIDTVALGWTTDGRAIVWMPKNGCGTSTVPGIYFVTPDGRPTLAAAMRRLTTPIQSSVRPRSEAEIRAALR
jgi:hypothetical protein